MVILSLVYYLQAGSGLPNGAPQYREVTCLNHKYQTCHRPGNTKEGTITVWLTSCLTGLDKSVLQIKTKIVSCLTANSNPVKQEVNGTVILPPLVFPA
jgi:hypothetical protein